MRIEVYETIADSGGAGLHRGGNGLCVGYRFLTKGNISIHDDRWLTHPWGVNGGEPGRRSSKRLLRADGSERWLPSKCDRIEVAAGDILYFNTWGGGGWGDPLERSAEQVALDVERGLVSSEGAQRYGVVVDADGGVNTAETEALRDRLRSGRGELPLFNFGGSVEELKSRCLQETHLPPPEQPVFATANS